MIKNKLVLKAWLIIDSVVFGVLAILSILPILMSPMLFDSPGNGDKIAIWIMLLGLVSFPIVVLVSIKQCWSYYKKESFVKSMLFSLLPIISVIFILVGFSLTK
jgi:hypothetical protein